LRLLWIGTAHKLLKFLEKAKKSLKAELK